MSHNHETGRRYLGQQCKLYTTDGIKDAVIERSIFNQDARILCPKTGFSILVNWPTVSRKMQGDKTFYAC